MDGRFRAAAERHVDLSRADHPRRVADGLHARRAGGHRGAQRSLEAMADRHMGGRHVAEKGRDGEGRQASRSLAVGGPHRFGDGMEAAHPGGDDGRRALLRLGALRRPAGLGQGLLRGGQGEEDEAVHLALFLGGQQQVGIEAGLRVLGAVGDLAADADGQVADQLRRERGDARLPGQQALPYGFDSAAQRADRAHAGDDDTFAHEGPSPSVPME